MRLILSRKGFDAANGGIPSPILPDGRLCPLPIPDERSSFRYDELSVAGERLDRLLADLRPKRLPPIQFAHLDPDLDPDSMARPPGWRPIFGQAGAARSHLRNQGVGVGDLFLFFGWFRRAEKVDGRFRFVPGTPDMHVLYGCLQVGAVWEVGRTDGVPTWVRSHVHFQRAGTAENEVVFVAAEKLALPGLAEALPGGGMFPRFGASLRLTEPGQSRSVWRLPGCFMPGAGKRPLTYHGDFGRWQPDGQDVILRTAPRGQEFVLHTEDYPGVIYWTTELLKDMVNS